MHLYKAEMNTQIPSISYIENKQCYSLNVIIGMSS